MRKYFLEDYFHSKISLPAKEDIDIIDATLQKEIPTKIEDVDVLRRLLPWLGISFG